MTSKERALKSTKIIAPILIGGATIGMLVDIGLQISSGSTDNLLMNIAGWLVFIAFIAFVWHATILHIEHGD
jgi:hypothetical protein